jgi:Ca-activated chloride channel family protein
VLVLLTDGSSNAGENTTCASGQAGGCVAAARLRSASAAVAKNSDLDEATLKTIAAETGGAYFQATDAAALQEAYARMDRLEPAAANDRWVQPSDEWFVWPLALALLLSVPAAALREPRWK